MSKYILCKHYAGDEVRMVAPEGKVPTGAMPAEDLPLVLTEPAAVRFGDEAYAVETEGLYRFAAPDNNLYVNVILFQGDLPTLFASLCRLHVHGKGSKDATKIEQKTEIARHGRLSLRCASFHSWAMHVLQSVGVPTRRVELMTLDEWNEWDNGHVLLEVLDPDSQRWFAVDLDTRTLFFDDDGRPLNILALARAVRGGKPIEFRRVCLTDGMDHQLAYDSFNEDVHLLDDAKHHWFSRIAHVPFICESESDKAGRCRLDQFFPFDEEEVCKRLEGYSRDHNLNFIGLPTEEWLCRFYK